MDEDDVSVTTVEARHRREKKELQAQIQALKKTVKGDKNKKKEVTAEINRLEFELESRQKKELESLLSIEVQNISIEKEAIENVPKIKISKAQKRRDKISQQEKERENLIKLQEKENIHGPRNIEIEQIKVKLKDKNLKIHAIPSDGDCLYKAISHQLEYIRQISMSVEELRKNVADYIKSHKDDFLPFMCNPETYEMLSDEEFEQYCDKISSTKTWGGQLEVKALSSYLKCPIQIVQATGPTSINQGEELSGPPLIITYHRHMYQLGEHYNSTEVVTEENE